MEGMITEEIIDERGLYGQCMECGTFSVKGGVCQNCEEVDDQ